MALFLNTIMLLSLLYKPARSFENRDSLRQWRRNPRHCTRPPQNKQYLRWSRPLPLGTGGRRKTRGRNGRKHQRKTEMKELLSNLRFRYFGIKCVHLERRGFHRRWISELQDCISSGSQVQSQRLLKGHLSTGPDRLGLQRANAETGMRLKRVAQSHARSVKAARIDQCGCALDRSGRRRREGTARQTWGK